MPGFDIKELTTVEPGATLCLSAACDYPYQVAEAGQRASEMDRVVAGFTIALCDNVVGCLGERKRWGETLTAIDWEHPTPTTGTGVSAQTFNEMLITIGIEAQPVAHQEGAL